MDNLEQINYKKIFDEVDLNLTDIVDEYYRINQKIGNDEKLIRVRFLLAFSLMEVVCNMYEKYFDLKQLTHKKLLPQWIKTYCFTEKNNTYKNHPYFKKITPEHLYNFRNSIVHALALPEPENGISICGTGAGDDTSDRVKKYDVGFTGFGHNVAFISPDSLTKLFIDGLTQLHAEIFISPENVTPGGVKGMERVLKEIRRRGAKSIIMK